MRLPNYNGDPQLVSMFRAIDEQLSELYSIHGKQSPRDRVELTATPGTEAPKANAIYKNNMIKAYGYYSDWAGTSPMVKSSFNISKVVRSVPGQYRWYFQTPMETKNYIVIPFLQYGAAHLGFIHNGANYGGQLEYCTIYIWDAAGFNDWDHGIVVIG
jgi:hypothetical protein